MLMRFILGLGAQGSFGEVQFGDKCAKASESKYHRSGEATTAKSEKSGVANKYGTSRTSLRNIARFAQHR